MRKKLFWVYVVSAVIAVAAGVAAGIFAVNTADLPKVSALEDYRPSATTRVFAADGAIVAEFFMENRTPVTLDHVPKHVREAFMAVEDPRFYRHSGIDLFGVARATIKNLMAGRVVQGGSTITQQLAKMLFLEPEKSYSRKIKEAVLSLQIERRYSKDEIFALYLNQVYLGSGAYGVESAARTYFGKSVDQLTLAEGAMLAGLPQAPSRYSPIRNPERALSRRHHTLTRMCDEGFITREEMEAADKEPVALKSGSYVSGNAPYFVEYIRQMLDERYGQALYRGGLNIYTSLDLNMQKAAEAAVVKGLAEVNKRHPRKGYLVQGALLAIEPGTGLIKAMVGGTDFTKSQYNRSVQAHRQPGSAFKPIVYAAAIDKGYRPEDIVMDSPVSYPGNMPGKRWSPSNYDNKYSGAISLRHALAMSINVVAVKLMDDVGVDKVIDCAHRLGIKSDMPPYLPLALGATDATLIEMTSAYAAFDNFGVYVEPMAITKITDREGRVVEEPAPASNQALSPDTAVTLTAMLEGVIQHGTGWKAKQLGMPVAGKTGTTSDYKDAWFIGYLPSLVTGVWVGYDDHKPIGKRETGAEAALPIWLDFMKVYVKQSGVQAEKFPPVPAAGFQNMSGLKLKVDLTRAGQVAAPAPEEPEVRQDEYYDEPPVNSAPTHLPSSRTP